jgi:hypothetical protein
VFVQCDNEEKSYIVAFDKKTGDELWRKSRDEKSNWSTPYVWENKARTELVTCGGTQIRSYDPATGEILWSPRTGQPANAAPPATKLLYVGTGGVVSARPDAGSREGHASGDITPKGDELRMRASPGAWSMARKWLHPLYEAASRADQRNGIVICYAPRPASSTTRNGSRARGFTASPWAATAHRLDEDGQTFVKAIRNTSRGHEQAGRHVLVVAAIAGDRLLPGVWTSCTASQNSVQRALAVVTSRCLHRSLNGIIFGGAAASFRR